MIELLAVTLPTRVGSQLSIKSLQEDLAVSPNAVSRWIEILEQLYFCYRIYPYGAAKLKAVKKAAKIYMWDWSMVEDQGPRFENLVASQLLKYCHYQEDCFGRKLELRYFRNVVNEKEIEFIVLEKNKPLFAVECKTGESQISKELVNSGKKLNIPELYQVHMGKKKFGEKSTGLVLPFIEFCKLLKMP